MAGNGVTNRALRVSTGFNGIGWVNRLLALEGGVPYSLSGDIALQP